MKRSYSGFEKTFHLLLEKAQKGPVTVRTLLTILSGRGKILLLIFLSLSFGQLPGISIFLGLFIGYLGISIALNRSSIWCPKFLLRKKISSYFLSKVIKRILICLKFIKRWSYPRYVGATRLTTVRVVNGLMIALVGLSLASSPPMPLAGFIAFAAIFFISMGLLNDDGIYVVIGYVFTLTYFISILALLNLYNIYLIKLVAYFRN